MTTANDNERPDETPASSQPAGDASPDSPEADSGNDIVVSPHGGSEGINASDEPPVIRYEKRQQAENND
jgi:hypothetical protein